MVLTPTELEQRLNDTPVWLLSSSDLRWLL